MITEIQFPLMKTEFALKYSELTVISEHSICLFFFQKKSFEGK